jgi:hypothetical protein
LRCRVLRFAQQDNTIPGLLVSVKRKEKLLFNIK